MVLILLNIAIKLFNFVMIIYFYQSQYKIKMEILWNMSGGCVYVAKWVWKLSVLYTWLFGPTFTTHAHA